LRDLDDVARLLARQRPVWPPGTRHGYHAMAIGFYIQELVRRVDPAHRTLGQFFREEVAGPLGLDFYIGLPPEISAESDRDAAPWPGAARTPEHAACVVSIALPWSLRKSMPPPPTRPALPEVGAGEQPVSCAIARLYSIFAEGGRSSASDRTPWRASRRRPNVLPKDEVLGVPAYFSLGFLRPGPDVSAARATRLRRRAQVARSAADRTRLGYAYVMNKTDYFQRDHRERRSDAVHRAIAKLGQDVPPRGGAGGG
jgi:CubicO group peptidase (beta-lactamase class C family)